MRRADALALAERQRPLGRGLDREEIGADHPALGDRLLGLSGYARLDLRLRPDGRFFVLEANPNPDLTYGEDFAGSAHAAGVEYEDLLERILRLGLSYAER